MATAASDVTFPAQSVASPYPIDPMPATIAALRHSAEPIWLFAYGSLMWNPEMAFAERRPARVYGYHRAFCLYSPEYRGTRDKPGLVLGLDRGGSCRGIAYRLPPDRLTEAIDHIWSREMTGGVYDMRRLTVTIPAGRIPAYAFAVRRDSRDYAGRLPLDAMACIIANSRGDRGTGRDYLANTVRHLEELGIADGPLHRLRDLVETLAPGD